MLALVLALAAAVPNPHAPDAAPVVLDFGPGAVNRVPLLPPADDGVRFHQLDDYRGRAIAVHPQGTLPDGWVQLGGVVVPGPGRELSAPPQVSKDMVPGPDATELCAFPDAVPAGVYPGEFRRGAEYPRHGTIYMNYVGAKLQNGNGDNSAEDWSALARSGHDYPVYTGGEDRAIAVAQAVQADFADWAVRIVYLKRPPKLLPYMMIMMGGHYTDTTAGPSGGVAPGADCEDYGLRNVCFAFVNNESVNVQANIASQELGHTMGLGHTQGSDRVMAFGYDTGANVDMGFGGECTPIITVQGQSGACSGVNKCHCGDGELQHDKATIAAVYAPVGPDVVPPEIKITAPADGAVFAEGDLVTVGFEPWDDVGGYGWKLVVEQDGKVLADVVDYNALLEFELKGLPAGKYTLRAVIQDHADHVGEHAITITVEAPAAPTTSDTDGDTDTDSGDTDDTGDTGDTDDAATGGAQDGDEGCGCRTPAGGPAWLLLGALALGRRRRLAARG